MRNPHRHKAHQLSSIREKYLLYISLPGIQGPDNKGEGPCFSPVDRRRHRHRHATACRIGPAKKGSKDLLLRVFRGRGEVTVSPRIHFSFFGDDEQIFVDEDGVPFCAHKSKTMRWRNFLRAERARLQGRLAALQPCSGHFSSSKLASVLGGFWFPQPGGKLEKKVFFCQGWPFCSVFCPAKQTIELKTFVLP